MDSILQRHADFERLAPIRQFYADHYAGGIDYPSKSNPTMIAVAAAAQSHPQPGHQGNTRYLWQYPSEPLHRYEHRLNRAWFVDILSPVVDFYAGTLSREIQIERGKHKEYDSIFDNVDLCGNSIEQFLERCRVSAQIYGSTFILVDSTRTTAEVATRADEEREGIRPYFQEITPQRFLNWRLDPATGNFLEVVFESYPITPQSILMGAARPTRVLFYWSTTEWRKFEVTTESEGKKPTVTQVGGAKHPHGAVPIVPLFHKKSDRAIEGESLLKNTAKIAHLLTNWASGLDEAIENQMFAVPVLKSKKKPSDIGVGIAAVMHLDPEEGEDFSYVTPDTAPFETTWSAFFRLISVANVFMGLEAPNLSGNPDVKSGVSKSWDYVKAEKVLLRMSLNEQETVKCLLEFAARWMGGKEYSGTIQYPTKFEMSSLDEDLNQIIKAQAAGLPPAARKALKRKYISKALPSVDEQSMQEIEQQLEDEAATPESDPFALAGGGQ